MKKVAEFLRLIDTHDGQVSLTNVALIIVLVKIAIAPSVSLTDLGALFAALLSYQGKKLINKDAGVSEEAIAAAETKASDAITLTGELLKRVDDLGSKVNATSLAMGIKVSK